MSSRRCVNLYLFAIREWANQDRMDDIAEALEAPNRWDAVRQAPAWWVDEDAAWSEFQRELRA